MSKFEIPLDIGDIRQRHREEQNLARQGRSQVISVSLTPASVGAQSVSEESFTVTGVASNDQVIVNGPAQTAGIVVGQARVSDKNTVVIPFANVTGGAVTPASGTYKVRVIR